jgi:hypothetical protein
MTVPMRHLLAFDASLANDPYICWLYAAQFAATANATPGSVGFHPMFRYQGPSADRLGMKSLQCHDGVREHKRRSVWEKLRISENPAVTVTSLTPEKRGLLKVVGELHADLHSIVLFGRDPADVVELAKLVHVGCSAVVPAIVCVVQRRRSSEIMAASLRELGIPLYLDVGYDQLHDAPHGPMGVDLQALSFWKESEYPFASRRGPDADWSRILSAVTPRHRAPVVLFLRPDWPHCGSFTTFKNIALRYAQRGTVLIDVAVNENKLKYSDSDASDRLWDSRNDLSPAFTYAAARSRTLPARWGRKARRRDGLVAEHVGRYAWAAAPRWFRKLLCASRPDYAYVNHYFTLDYLRRLKLEIPVLLDTHDIQAVNYVHHKYSSRSKGRSETFSQLLENELGFFRRASAIAFVSADELDLVAPMLPGVDMFHFIAVPKIVPIMRSRRDDGSRVLIVASRNPANEANIDWFLQNVWPRLQGTGAALDVVGTISGYFEGKPVPVACTFHGSVPSLVTYYGNCDVVALPIVTGAGVAIKTIEALLHERPICATPHAFRGLGHAVGSLFPRLDDAVAFAEDLRSLIEDPGAARRRLELCREAARALAPEKFDAAFDARHRALLAAACQKRRPDPLSPVAGKGLG